MSELRCEFYASEEGEPFCAFVYGQVPFDRVATDAVRAKILREVEIWDLEAETIATISEAMQAEPAHLWIRQEGSFEDSPYYFCKADDEGAIAITGWKLR
nr:hypothetical protein [Methylobacterium sp. ZNC0032]